MTSARMALGAWLWFCSLSVAGAQPAPPVTGATNVPFWTGISDVATFDRAMDARLAHARATLDALAAVQGARSIDNTLRPYDDILLELDAVGSQAQLIQEVHPDDKLRHAAEEISQKVSAFATGLSLNRRVYDALVALDVRSADAETQHYMQRTLRDFRLAGVDKDEATRKKIQALRDALVVIGQDFDRNIRTDLRTVTARSAAELDGLPADYIARHKPGADGAITLTIDYPDSLPVFSYAKNEELRKRMYMEYQNRAYPANIAVLDRMIATRAELASLLGFSDWANYITADKMVESAANASAFIDRIVAASGDKAQREYAALLKRKQADVPGATGVNAWESGYYSELARKASYDFDSQSVRPYFPFDRVKQGLLDVTSTLFGVTYRPVKGVPVWDPSVETYEMLQNGVLVGRFYLDMHPRTNKYNHAAQFGIRTGVEGRQIPEAALICNLPGGQAGDPGLMTHEDVETFFHEFGHLVHALIAGHHRWVGIGGNNTEQDFVEAPSQMLEEWTWDPATLATFAKHYQTNQPIPAALVRQMRRANEFGKALNVRQQMIYAKLSLSIYDRDPKQVDTTAMVKELTNKYRPFPYVEGTHLQTAFGHLDGYSAVYYTYMWSLVIAKDMFSQFDRANLLASPIARKYRDTILAPGGSKPATALLHDFLGRSFEFKAWEEWLNRDEQ
ncbi:MAG TPA: M3 family metallopeptidase [Vicinamibacterales bacterium]|nr:M3 family metallopeptidase [Vicinamibacterales bacterium]